MSGLETVESRVCTPCFTDVSMAAVGGWGGKGSEGQIIKGFHALTESLTHLMNNY